MISFSIKNKEQNKVASTTKTSEKALKNADFYHPSVAEEQAFMKLEVYEDRSK